MAEYQGKIYVFGGGGTDFKSLNSTEIYDPETDAWHQGADMPTNRSGAVAAVLHDQIYVMGGGVRHPDGKFDFFKTVEIYHPETDTWSEGPDMRMPHDYPSAAVMNGCIYVLGGHHPEATKGGPMTDPGFSFCEVLAPGTRIWQEIAPMPTPRFAFASVVLNNRILALGGAGLRKDGFKNFDVVESYDPVTNQWSEAGFKLPWPAAGAGVCVNNNRLYISGGNNGEKIEERFACYRPDLHQWTGLDPLKEGRIVMGTVTIGEMIYLIGGRGADGKTPLASMDAYRIIH
jgi:N-acetylneuraminic acid mutarotase